MLLFIASGSFDREGGTFSHSPCNGSLHWCPLCPGGREGGEGRGGEGRLRDRGYWCVKELTLGPQRACLVAQQISVLQTLQRIQSQPSFFCTTIKHLGQVIASPSATSFYRDTASADLVASLSVRVFPHVQHLLGGLGSLVVGGSPAEVVLILLAVNAFVDGLAGQTVHLQTQP